MVEVNTAELNSKTHVNTTLSIRDWLENDGLCRREKGTLFMITKTKVLNIKTSTLQKAVLQAVINSPIALLSNNTQTKQLVAQKLKEYAINESTGFCTGDNTKNAIVVHKRIFKDYKTNACAAQKDNIKLFNATDFLNLLNI